MESDVKVSIVGDNLELSREQWREKRVMVSNYPGLLEEVLKYTWTCTAGSHPYIRCEILNHYLHYFVLAFLYGKDKLDTMLQSNTIIEHLDNNGLNCTYENLHILSSDENKAKALTIDKQKKDYTRAPVFITDVFYSHTRKYFQMQLTYNENVVWNMRTGRPIEQIIIQYGTFTDLFSDWLIVAKHHDGRFDFSKFRGNCMHYKDRPLIELKPEEKDAAIIERDGKHFARLNPHAGTKSAWIEKTPYINLENLEE